MKNYALFVDDEQLVLNGLKRNLRSLRHDWEIKLATSGQEALDLMDNQEFSVIVSDMKMPGMDGGNFLKEAAKRHPGTALLALSGYAELDLILRAVLPAHQFLAKPCDPNVLKEIFQRIGKVRRDHDHSMIHKTLSIHRRLPSPRETIEKLSQAVQEESYDSQLIEQVVINDIAMTAQLLRLMNSAFFSRPLKIFDAVAAAEMLGPYLLGILIKDVELFRPVDSGIEDGDEAVIRLNQKAMELAEVQTPPDIDPKVAKEIKGKAMLSMIGSLAAIETLDPLTDNDAQSLNEVFLAFWGLDTNDHVIQVEAANTSIAGAKINHQSDNSDIFYTE